MPTRLKLDDALCLRLMDAGGYPDVNAAIDAIVRAHLAALEGGKPGMADVPFPATSDPTASRPAPHGWVAPKRPIGWQRDPARIDRMLERLATLWKRWPQLRLGQLLVNLTGRSDPFYVEDDEVEARMETDPREGEAR